MRLSGLAVAAVVIAHFCIGVRLRLSTGMTGFDTTWYHGPFAAGFAQSGRTFGIQFIAPQFLAWFYPQNSELLHGIGILAFSRDLLSPLLNLGWLGGCLLAAWCIGRPWGAAPVTLAGAALVLGSGAFADQAGEARNDIVALFFVLAAVAIVLNAAALPSGRRPPASLPVGAMVLAGLSIGLAAGTKVNYLAAALALVGSLPLIAPRGERLRALAASGLPALAGCGFWYLRNLIHAGNPLPWVKHLGPIALPSPDQAIGGREGFGVLHYLTDPGVWSDWFAPGLHQGLGVLWPVILAAALAGALLCMVGRGSEPALRASAVVAVALIAAWLVAPASASGPDGEPLGFLSGLRYLVPALALGLALLPLAPPLRTDAARWAVLAALALALPFTVASGIPWYSGYLAAAVLASVLAVEPCGPARVRLALGAPPAGDRPTRRRRDPPSRPGSAASGPIWRTATPTPGSRPRASTPPSGGRARSPIGGSRPPAPDSIRCSAPSSPTGSGSSACTAPRPASCVPAGCRSWRRALNEGGYDYVVASLDRIEPGRPQLSPGGRLDRLRPGGDGSSCEGRRPSSSASAGRLDPAACP